MKPPMTRVANALGGGFFSPCGLLHIHSDPILGAFVLVELAHRLIFVLKFDLLDAPLFSLHRGVRMQRDKFTRLLAGIVMLVPRAGGRGDTGRFVPVVPFGFFPLVPHQGVTRRVEQKHMSTGAMAMRLLVPSYRKLRNVSQHRASGHMNIHVARALAALLAR